MHRRASLDRVRITGKPEAIGPDSQFLAEKPDKLGITKELRKMKRKDVPRFQVERMALVRGAHESDLCVRWLFGLCLWISRGLCGEEHGNHCSQNPNPAMSDSPSPGSGNFWQES